MPHRVIDNKDDLADFITFIRGFQIPFTVEWRKGRDRSLDQNNLQWLWATEAAYQRGDLTPAEIQKEWKLRYGVPILREDNAIFREVYDEFVRPHPYERKLDAMEWMEVTSAMTVRQMVRYLDTVQRENLQQGIRLTDPDPMLAKYQARYREKAA